MYDEMAGVRALDIWILEFRRKYVIYVKKRNETFYHLFKRNMIT